MDERTLFRIALGLDDPWEVKEIKFDAEKQQLDIFMDFPKGSKLLCPECDQLCGVHDTTQKTWRHLNFFQHLTYLHARVPRIKGTTPTINAGFTRN